MAADGDVEMRSSSVWSGLRRCGRSTVTGPSVPKHHYKYRDVQQLLEGGRQDFTGEVLSDSLSLSLSLFLSVSSISV